MNKFTRSLDINITETRDFAYIVMEVIGRPVHIAEVGVYSPGHMQILPFAFDHQCKIQLFDPLPQCADQLRAFFKGCENVEINEVAIGADFGQAELVIPEMRKSCPDTQSSAFLEGTHSPYHARENAGRPENLMYLRVEVVPLKEFDDGTIDAITIDTEGHEWPVLQTMVSRPKVVQVEMRGQDGYENANRTLIEEWMRWNRYVEHHIGKTDVIYVRSE
jgi:FkbM family methyltransferase